MLCQGEIGSPFTNHRDHEIMDMRSARLSSRTPVLHLDRNHSLGVKPRSGLVSQIWRRSINDDAAHMSAEEKHYRMSNYGRRASMAPEIGKGPLT